MKHKRSGNKLLPGWLRFLISGSIPRLYRIVTLVLENPDRVTDLVRLPENYTIREVSEEDIDLLKVFSDRKGSRAFKHNTLPRLVAPGFTGLAVINTEKNEIAYLSWVISGSIPYLEEFGINIQEGEYLVKDIFVVPEYRNLGLSSRMEQERINYCLRQGECRGIYIQILSSNKKGLEVYKKLGYRVLQEDYLIRWYIFNIFRSLNGFVRNPLSRIVK